MTPKPEQQQQPYVRARSGRAYRIPVTPNFIFQTNGDGRKIEDVDEGDLVVIGQAWLSRLIFEARNKRKTKPGGNHVD